MGALYLFLIAATLFAQQVIEKGSKIIYENTAGGQTNLGSGHSPVLTNDGNVALIRGPHHNYGESFDCQRPQDRDRVVLFDTRTSTESVLFQKALSFARSGMSFCFYDQMQLSPDRSILYLVGLVNATSGTLAIIRLKDERIRYVQGVEVVYVIPSGTHAGESSISNVACIKWFPIHGFTLRRMGHRSKRSAKSSSPTAVIRRTTHLSLRGTSAKLGLRSS